MGTSQPLAPPSSPPSLVSSTPPSSPPPPVSSIPPTSKPPAPPSSPLLPASSTPPTSQPPAPPSSPPLLASSTSQPPAPPSSPSLLASSTSQPPSPPSSPPDPRFDQSGWADDVLPDYCPMPVPKEISDSPPPSPSTKLLREYRRRNAAHGDAEYQRLNAAFSDQDDDDDDVDDIISNAVRTQRLDSAEDNFQRKSERLRDVQEKLADLEIFTVTNFAEFEVLTQENLLGKKIWVHSATPSKDIVAMQKEENDYAKARGLDYGIRMIIESTLTDEERVRGGTHEGKSLLFAEKFPDWVTTDSADSNSTDSNSADSSDEISPTA